MPFFSRDPNETNESLEGRARESFERRGQSPAAWRFQAHALLDAAAILWDQIDKADSDQEARGQVFSRFGPIAHMLGGLGLEALAKAVRVAKDPNLVSDGQWQLREHDLVKLFSGIGLPLDQKERSVLVQLTGFLVWAGRYPIPLEARGLAAKIVSRIPQKLPQIELAPGTFLGRDDRRIIGELVERLEKQLRAQPKGGPDG